ncbi:unnamed protein product [Caenorhabditis auriculariae]|uniref:Uncharacterized protein n=1 Tax=Caenorhabditis auriculariae TaxID=2777116 RepID=A0A8S1GVK5_9PELO|nr:unnamed protein product [Caenorhabditis auriculariae]
MTQASELGVVRPQPSLEIDNTDSAMILPFLLFLVLFDRCSAIGAKFDYFMLTKIYPTAVCRADDDTVPDSCEIPDGTPSWTMHGLWPNFANGSYPQFCPAVPKHFNEDLIKLIEPKLTNFWPNLYPSKSKASFWKHEYDKHGTCAQSEKNFDSELKYFQQAIDLFALFDVDAALSSLPRGSLVTKAEVLQALQPLSKSQSVQIHCLRDKKTSQTLLADVRLCINKDLSPRACPDRLNNRLPTVSDVLPNFVPCPGQFVYLPLSPETTFSHPKNLNSISL